MSEVDWVHDWITSPGSGERFELSHGAEPRYDDYTGEFIDE